MKNDLKVVKEHLAALVHEYQVISYNDIARYYDLPELDRALSELVMDNSIKRFEYILSGESTRRCFYMRADSRLML